MYRVCERCTKCTKSNQRSCRSLAFWFGFERHLCPSTYSHTSTSVVRVDDSVPFQMVHQDEGFPALRAAVRPFPAMSTLVDPQAALLREPLPTLSTPERLLARVCPVVYAEVGRTLKAFPTHRAPERSLSLVALLVQLELVQAAERLSTLRANIASCHTRERSVRVVATWCETVVRVGYHWFITICRVPLRTFIWLSHLSNMWEVRLWMNLFLVPVLLCLNTLRSGLKTGRLRDILLILTVVDPVTWPLRGWLQDTSRLTSVGNQMCNWMVRERVGILLHHTRKVRKTRINVVAFNYRWPELILPFIHGIVSSKLVLLPCNVLASTVTEPRSVLLLLRLNSELKTTHVSCMMTWVIRATVLWGLLSGYLWRVQLTVLLKLSILRRVLESRPCRWQVNSGYTVLSAPKQQALLFSNRLWTESRFLNSPIGPVTSLIHIGSSGLSSLIVKERVASSISGN